MGDTGWGGGWNEGYSGGCFKALNITLFKIEDCQFNYCYIKNTRTMKPNGAIATLEDVKTINVKNAKFDNCKCYWGYNSPCSDNKLFHIPYEMQNEENFKNCKLISSLKLY